MRKELKELEEREKEEKMQLINEEIEREELEVFDDLD